MSIPQECPVIKYFPYFSHAVVFKNQEQVLRGDNGENLRTGTSVDSGFGQAQTQVTFSEIKFLPNIVKSSAKQWVAGCSDPAPDQRSRKLTAH